MLGCTSSLPRSFPVVPRRIGTALVIGAALALAALPGCQSSGGSLDVVQAGYVPAGAVSPEDLLVVDCLLPGKVRKLGRGQVFMTPRRPTQTSASECEIRGGEYTAYDRADYRTALRIWLDSAHAGAVAYIAAQGQVQ